MIARPAVVARRGLKRSGMVERDAVAPRVTPDGTGNGERRFTAFDGNNDRRTVPIGKAARWVIGYAPDHGGSISIAQRDMLRVGGRGCRDALGSAGLVVASRRVIDVEGKGARMAGDFKGVAAVGRDGNLDGGSGGGPHLDSVGGGNGRPRCGLILRDGITGRGGYLAADGGGVRCSRGSSAAAGRGTGGQEYRRG